MANGVTRRQFLAASVAAAAGLAIGGRVVAEEKKEIRIGMIGLGARGSFLLGTMLSFPGVAISAVCDIDANAAKAAQDLTEQKTGKRPAAYTNGEDDWKRLCERDDLDAIVIVTPWKYHTKMAVAAMRAGKYVGLEIPACQTMHEARELLETAEKTGMHCMFLENVNYFRNVMAIDRMIHEGLLGEVTHSLVGYQHDCRFLAFREDGTLSWRGEDMARLDGNLYPTHPIGPVAWWMDINRGDRFVRISSMSSASKGLRDYAAHRFGAEHPLAKRKYALGDTNTTLLETANGKTVTLYFDLCSTRPYDMIFRVQGTRGCYEGNRDAIYLEGVNPKDQWEGFSTKYQPKYDHQLWQELGKEAEANGGHGGCDYLMVHEFLKAVRTNSRPPIDIYDAVTWSAIVPLSIQSVANNGQALDFPDLTGGRWKDAGSRGIGSRE